MEDQKRFVESATSDITELKTLLAVSKDKRKTINTEYSTASDLDGDINAGYAAALRKLYEKNQRRLSRLSELEVIFIEQLTKICSELSVVDDELAKYEQHNEHKRQNFKTRVLKFGTPYFRYNRSIPPDNSDVLLLRKMGDIRYVDVPKPLVWQDSEKKCLVNAIEVEERRRQSKDIEIEMLKIKKKLETCYMDEQSELESELDALQQRLLVTKRLKGKQLLQNSLCKHDWMKISVVDMKGKHSPQECQSMWTNYLHPTINKGRWKKDEDERLKFLVNHYEFCDWDTIAQELGTSRSAFQCMCHYQNRLNPVLTRSTWDEKDDSTLKVLVNSFRKGDYIPWKKIAYCFSNCSVANVVTRWKSIDPNVTKGKFSEAEDVCLIAAVRKFGTDFKKIADHFPGRTSSQLIERYRSFLKHEQGTKRWTPEEDRLIWEKVQEFGHNFSHIATYFINRNRTQIRHRYNRMLQWLRKHPGEVYPACRSGPCKIADGPDELWKKAVNVMKDKNVKFREIDGEAIIDDSSFSSLKSKMKLKKKCGPKPGHQKPLHNVDLQLANYFSCVYPRSGGRYRVNYTDEEVESDCRGTLKFLEFLGARLRCVSEEEIENDEMLSKIDQLFLKRISNSEGENGSTTEVQPSCSVSTVTSVTGGGRCEWLPCKICNIKHGDLPYINVCHNAVPPNQTTLVGIRSIMLWRNVLRSISHSPEVSMEDTEDEYGISEQNGAVQVEEPNRVTDRECIECVREAQVSKDDFEKHSNIWQSRFRSVFTWAALCSEHVPNMPYDSCVLGNEFDEKPIVNSVALEVLGCLNNTDKRNGRKPQKKIIKMK